MSTQDNSDKLAEALNNHQVTDEGGQIPEETTSDEEAAPLEQTPEYEVATAEKSAETDDSTPVEEKETENEPEMVETATDDAGKRYVPESRFKEIYAKWKKAEREAKAEGRTPPQEPISMPAPQRPLDKTAALEREILRSTLPQFNPESDQYSRELDELGFSILEGSKDSKGQYTMTMIDAGRKALAMAKKITSKVADAKSEARTVKAQQSDHGITNRVLNREGTKVDPEKMSLEEKEAWLKETGNW